jgi:thioredoxin reductase
MPDTPMNSGDVAVIGASFAGLTAALYLARSRRRVMLFDTRETRNRFAPAAHGFLGQNGRSPADIRLAGLADVLAYPGVTHLADRVTTITATAPHFRLTTASGVFEARQVVLAFGMRDILPPLPGLAECWGISAMQCPFCHGYELADLPTGVLMTGPASLHHARMLRQWTGDLTLFINGHALTDVDRAGLADRGIRLTEGRVAGLDQRDGNLAAVVLQDGQRIARRVLYLAPRAEPACGLAAQLGCAMTEGPNGPYLIVDALQATSVPGVFAAGDVARPMYGAVFAAADGAMAAVACSHALIG